MANLGYTLQAPGYIQSQNEDYMQSQNGEFFATVQDDGNFCVYKGTYGNPQGGAVWCAFNVAHNTCVYYAAMQTDGHLCVYNGTPNHQLGGATWCSSTYGPEGQYFVELQGDGDLNVYAGTPQEPGKLMWSSG